MKPTPQAPAASGFDPSRNKMRRFSLWATIADLEAADEVDLEESFTGHLRLCREAASWLRDLAPSKGGDLVERNSGYVRDAYDRIMPADAAPFNELDGGHRSLAFAAALLAESEPRRALQAIAEMETESANATVRRMARCAREALRDSDTRPQDGDAVPAPIDVRVSEP